MTMHCNFLKLSEMKISQYTGIGIVLTKIFDIRSSCIRRNFIYIFQMKINAEIFLTIAGINGNSQYK